MNDQQFEIIKLHKLWADRFTIVWQIIAVSVIAGIYFLLDQMGATPMEKTDALILLAAIVIVSAVWQAAGLAIARIHMIVRGLNLDSSSQSRRAG